MLDTLHTMLYMYINHDVRGDDIPTSFPEAGNKARHTPYYKTSHNNYAKNKFVNYHIQNLNRKNLITKI